MLYRDSIEHAKAKLVRQLTAAVRTTIAIEDTITSRLETLFEQTMHEDGEETVSEVASLPEAEDSIPEGFRRRQATGMLATSTPAAPAGARALGRFCVPRTNMQVDKGAMSFKSHNRTSSTSTSADKTCVLYIPMCAFCLLVVFYNFTSFARSHISKI